MPNNQVAMSELTSEIWEMEPRRLVAFLSGLADYRVHIPEASEAKEKTAAPAPAQSGGVAIIPINGILMNSVPKWFSGFGIEATSYGDIIAMVKAAVVSDDVERIHLQVNSPGGTVAGVHEASQAIFNARKSKQVTAHINDLGASAAYHLAAQAETISVGPNAEVGSIGVFSVYVDSSKAAEDEGFKVHIIRSGDHKGMGVPGVEITADQLASQQAVVDGMADNFIKSVATGRDMKVSEVRKLATGETWIAKTAKSNGLVDSVVGAAKSDSNSNTKGSNMDTEKNTIVQPKVDIEKIQTEAGKEAVTEDRERLSVMQDKFPDDLDFAVEQFLKGASLVEARADFGDLQTKRLAEAKKNQVKPEPKTVGAPAIGHSEGGEQGADDFLMQVKALAKELGIKKSEAIVRLKKDDPELFARSQNK